MRRALLAGLILIVLLGGGATLLLQDEDRAPLPSEGELRMNGFAVWPEDTVAEGMDACEDAETWRLDPKETAFRFAREVLRYPQPDVNAGPLIDEERTAEEIRYLLGTGGVRGVFLGSVIDVRKYDRCWFVVNLEPREGGWLPSIGYLHGDGGTQLAVRMDGPGVKIGYGKWRRHITQQRGQVVLDPPELEHDVTGHIMALSPYQQVLDGSASPLGFIPQPATNPVTRLSESQVVTTPGICGDDSYHRPQAAIADLYAFTLDSGGTRGQKVGFDSERAVHRRGAGWQLHVDGTELATRIPKIKEGCHRILFIHDRRAPILESLHVGRHWFTFDLDWRKARSAEISLISASGRGGSAYGTFNRVDGTLTLRIHDRLPANEPFYVTVILRRGREVVSAERSWYRTE